MSDLSARVDRLAQRRGASVQAELDESTEPVVPPRPDNKIDRRALATARGYKGQTWEGLARMAYARRVAGIELDELDLLAISRVTEDEAFT